MEQCGRVWRVCVAVCVCVLSSKTVTKIYDHITCVCVCVCVILGLTGHHLQNVVARLAQWRRAWPGAAAWAQARVDLVEHVHLGQF